MSNAYLKMRKGIFEHLAKGWMDDQMIVAYMIMLDQCDWKSGVWVGCADKLVAAMGYQWSKRTAERVLERLVKFKYVDTKYIRGKKGSYPILINNYIPTDGTQKNVKLRQVAAGNRNPLTDVRIDATDMESDDKSNVKTVAASAKVTTEVTTKLATKVASPVASIQEGPQNKVQGFQDFSHSVSQSREPEPERRINVEEA